MNITIKQLKPEDIVEFIGMLQLFEDVFEMKEHQIPYEGYLSKLLSRADFIVYIALHNDAVVGGLTAHVLPSYYFQSSEVYVYDLAVKTTFQRKGIGRKLLRALTAYCELHHYKEFFVQADEPDTHALEFYRSTGGIAEKVVHFNYPIK